MTGRVGRRRLPGFGPGDDAGQSSVELALALPLVLALLLLVVQVGLLVHDVVQVQHASREGARVAAVDADPLAARRAAQVASGLPEAGLDVEVRGRNEVGSTVTVTVAYRSPVKVLFVRFLTDVVTVTASTSMRVER